MDSRPHILVVDDRRMELFAMLEAEGYAVGTASDGREALKYAIRNRPDVVVIDARLPEIEQIRFACPNTRVVGSDGDVVQAVRKALT